MIKLQLPREKKFVYEKTYSCNSKMIISYESKKPKITFEFSYSRNVFAMDQDYQLFIKAPFNPKTKRLLAERDFKGKYIVIDKEESDNNLSMKET